MGSSSWSNAAYAVRSTSLKDKGYKDGLVYDADLRRSGGPFVVHEKMDPKGVVRESRDSDAHPESVAIAVLFDVTGSMGEVPRVFQSKLPQLMSTILRKGYVEHPHILYGAIGDATCDRVPLQIGQFEAGIEMDEDLGRILCEGGGGGQTFESYELAMYFMARKTVTDCLEKRGKKGYCFILGDEQPYPKVDRRQVEAIIGDKLGESIETKAIAAELQEKYEVFFINPGSTSHHGDSRILGTWKKLFGQNVLDLSDPTAVCELIATTIGLCEEAGDMDDIARDLVAAGADKSKVNAATKALSTYVKAKGGTVSKAKSSKKVTTGSDVEVESV